MQYRWITPDEAAGVLAIDPATGNRTTTSSRCATTNLYGDEATAQTISVGYAEFVVDDDGSAIVLICRENWLESN